MNDVISGIGIGIGYWYREKPKYWVLGAELGIVLTLSARHVHPTLYYAYKFVNFWFKYININQTQEHIVQWVLLMLI